MKAYRIEQDGKLGRGAIVEMAPEALDPGDVTLRTRHAGVNYKDALAGLGGAPIIRRYPCNGGIEAVGRVTDSRDARFAPGDWVIVHGRGIGVSHDGGLAEYLRVPGDWVLPLPAGLSPLEAATLGVAGYSAGLAIDRLEGLGLTPTAGPVVVSGATGGVGSLAVAMLAGCGYDVTALSSKPDDGFLRGLGAQQVIALPAPSGKPLEREHWAGGIDAAGGPVLEWMLASSRAGGAVASIGNAAGIALNTTVLPFILRGVTLHADGYAGFEELYRSGAIREVACMAHVRRKFVDVHRAQGSPIAEEAIRRIGQLYAVEKKARGSPPDRRVEIRQTKAAQILDDLEAWLAMQLTRISGKSPLAGAIRYGLTRMNRLRPYPEHGILELDNNVAERGMRAIALGRKNYLFVGSEAGGKAAAIAYTLIETAKLNGVDPHAWLANTIAQIPDYKITKVDELMPWRWNG